MAKIPPADTPIIDRQSGRMSLEWYTALQRIVSELVAIGGGGVVTFEGRNGVVVSANGDYTASEITNVAAGNISSVTVQTAINELDTDKAPNSRLITSGDGLTGGGDLSADRTLAVVAGTGISVAADSVSTNDAQIVHDNLSGFVADEHIAHSGVTLTAGAGLTGGGTIEASRTFDIGAGTGITVNANDVAITAGGVGTTQLADGGVTVAKIEDAEAYTILLRNAGTTGDSDFVKISALTNAGAFGSGDKIMIEESSGELRKIDFDDLPGASTTSDIALLDAGTASAAATIDISLVAHAGYRAYTFIVTSIVPATDNTTLWARTSTDGGATFAAGASDYAWVETFAQASAGGTFGDSGDNADSEIELGGGFGNAAGESGSIELTLYNPANTTLTKHIAGTATKTDQGGLHVFGTFLGARLATADIDAVRFMMSSGNITATYALYGVS